MADGLTGDSSSCHLACSILSMAMTQAGNANRSNASPAKGNCRPFATTDSGNRWTRCATKWLWRNCGDGSGTMESVGVTQTFWHGKRVFLTGHTGFKGGWMSLWLQSLGAEVHGYALAQPSPNFFSVARVGDGMASSEIADIRVASHLAAAMRAVQPAIVFHLAAQPLVRYSYAEPAETYAVNVWAPLTYSRQFAVYTAYERSSYRDHRQVLREPGAGSQGLS